MKVKPLTSFSASDRPLLRDIANLNTGAASGVSRALLSYFGEFIPLPYYHGGQIHFRNVAQDTSQIFFSGKNDTPLKVYPNPTSGDITIEWEHPEKPNTILMVYNFFGQKVLEINDEINYPFRLKTDDWKNGVHWIIVQDIEGSSYFVKVLIFKN